MTTAEELHHLARQLANTYATLAELRWTPVRQIPVRKMEPVFGPMSPEPDQDWTLNLEHELMRDTPDERIPGRLRAMVRDAMSYTSTRHGWPDETRPGMLCAYIARYASEIAAYFPAAEDLAELLTEQHHYLTTQINRRYGTHKLTAIPPGLLATGYGTAADLAAYVAAATGKPITRETIRSWGRNNHITQYVHPDGSTVYSLAQVIDYAHTYTPRRKTP